MLNGNLPSSELCSKVIDKFGRTNQIIKCIEECSELIQALSKYILLDEDDPNIAEELADVSIMLTQMFYIFDYNQVREWEINKMMYLEELIKEKE